MLAYLFPGFKACHILCHTFMNSVKAVIPLATMKRLMPYTLTQTASPLRNLSSDRGQERRSAQAVAIKANLL